MNQREIRGNQIAQKQNQINRLDESYYKVKSQNSNSVYDIIATEFGWNCSCPDHQFRKVCCKHIHAIEISSKFRKKLQNEIEIPEVVIDSCKYCESTNIKKIGIRHNKSGDIQRLECIDCKRKFSFNLGFEKMRATPEQITIAMNLYFNGKSSRKTAQSLSIANVDILHITVQNWIKKYTGLMEKYLDKITTQVGENWRTDEVYLRIKGDQKYLFALLDSETRFWLAGMVAQHKGNDDVVPMFKDAKKKAGKIPDTLISDGASNFHHAWEKEYKSKNFLHKETEHISHIHLTGDMNNNQMESFNGNTIRAREKTVRGIKKEDSAVLTGMKIHHNFIRPHQGLDGDTPADRAGIRVKGKNKWKTIIQNASKDNV